MSELSPEARAFLAQHRSDGEPTPEEVAGLKRRVLAGSRPEGTVVPMRAARAVPAVDAPGRRSRFKLLLAAAAVLVVVAIPGSLVAVASKQRWDSAARDQASEREFREADALVDRGQWAEARTRLLALRDAAPTFRSDGVESLLARSAAEASNQAALDEAERALAEERVGPAREALARVTQPTAARERYASLLRRLGSMADAQSASGAAQRQTAAGSGRFSDPSLNDALGQYVAGNSAAALRLLKTTWPVSADPRYRAQAARLVVDLSDAEATAEAAMGALSDAGPLAALEHVRRALALDERLVLGAPAAAMPSLAQRAQLEKAPSALRLMLTQAMARETYLRGRDRADRKDLRGACALWKLGMSFAPADNDLLKASFFCTQKAQRTLELASSCEELAETLEFAVAGDGIREGVEAKRTSLRCPPVALDVEAVPVLDSDATTVEQRAGDVLARVDANFAVLLKTDADVDAVQAKFARGDLDGAVAGAKACAKKTTVCQTLVGQLAVYRARSAQVARLPEDQLEELLALDARLGGWQPSAQSRPLRARLAASLYAKAEEARRSGSWAAALDLAHRTLAVERWHQGAGALLTDARSQAKDAYLRGYQLKDTSPDEAAKSFKQVMAMTPSSDEYHQKAAIRLRELLAR